MACGFYKIKEKEQHRAMKRKPITGRLHSSFTMTHNRWFEAFKAGPSANQVSRDGPLAPRLSAMSARGWENDTVDVEVEVSGLRDESA